jgi:hypothetical protein
MSDNDNDEEVLNKSNGGLAIPRVAKIVIVLVLSIVIWYCIDVYQSYLEAVKINTPIPPSNLGIPAIFLFSFSALLVIAVPWYKFGMRIRKFGLIEFEEIISNQTNERSEDMVFFRNKLIELEARLNKAGVVIDHSEPSDLAKLIYNFLKKKSTRNYSPKSIQKRGGEIKEFASLADEDLKDIKRELREMVASGKLVIRVSERGNNLYRIK